MSSIDREAVLRPLRDRIDALDDQLVTLLAERMRTVDEVIAIKKAHGIAARLDGRVEEVVDHVRAKAGHIGAPPDLAEALWRCMIDWVIDYENGHLGTTSEVSNQHIDTPK